MKVGWAPRPPEPRESVLAGAFAAATGLAVGMAAFYLARLLLFREEVLLEPPPRGEEEARE